MDKTPDSTFYAIDDVQSTTECTGLMPAMPPDVEGAEELSGLKAIHCPPGAMAEGQANPQWEHAVAHPSDVHSQLTKKAASHQASSPARNHPAQGRNQPGFSPSQARER